MANSIYFFEEDVSVGLKKKSILKKWISFIANNEGFSVNNLNYIFCSDAYLHTLNVQYLSHDTFTDIITFQYNDITEHLHSDMYISYDRCIENALNNSVSSENELHRLLCHGVLHLCGYKDKSKSSKKLMTSKEDYYLSLLKTQFNL